MRNSAPVKPHVRPDPQRRLRPLRLLHGRFWCALLREAVEIAFVLIGLVRHLLQLENHAVGLQSHQGVELIFCNLDAVGGPLGAEMELLVDLALTVELQQPDGCLQHQKALEACAGTVAPVAVGPQLIAGFLLQPGRSNDDQFLDIQ